MNWLDRIPLYLIIPPAVLMAISPIGQQPHLIEKLGMLFSGDLSQGIDIFDLLMHGLPSVLLIHKISRMNMAPPEAE
jgi:hypothetical protein